MIINRPYLIISLVSALLFIPFLGQTHLFDWDEINFAEMAREMIVTGDYLRLQVNFLPFWEKPPLFIWMQLASMKIFGVGEFAARFPNAILGIITLLILFRLGRKLYDDSMGWFWVAAYAGSFLPHFYFKSGIIDPAFNLGIFLGIYFFSRMGGNTTHRMRNVLLSGLFIGLALLTKGPVAVLVTVLCGSVYLILSLSGLLKMPGKPLPSVKELLVWSGIVFLVSLAWFGADLYQNGIFFIEEFIRYQVRLLSTDDAGHGGPWFYHPVLLLIGCFPASILMLRLFKKESSDNEEQHRFKIWMLLLFWVTLVLFSVVQSKIVHYSSLCYFPLTYLAAYCLHKIHKGEWSWKVHQSVLLLVIGLLLGIAFTLLPIAGRNLELVIPYVKDPFAVANMRAEVEWPVLLENLGLLYIAVVIWAFVMIRRKKIVRGFLGLFVATAIMFELMMVFMAPRIEQYTQRASIEFLESLAGKDVYVDVLGYKSYAHLFYTRKPLHDNPKNSDRNWLLHGDIDKDVYFVTRIDRLDGLQLPGDVKEVGRKNGFVFLKREAK